MLGLNVLKQAQLFNIAVKDQAEDHVFFKMSDSSYAEMHCMKCVVK